MKKSVLFAIFVLCGIMFVGCGHNVATGNGGGGGSSGEDPVEKIERMTYMGESTETIDGITYTVKAYAEVFGDPYCYNYYKYYYLNSKLRRVYQLMHNGFYGEGVPCLDYKYTEFVDHLCGKTQKFIYTYNGNGILETLSRYKYGYLHDFYVYYVNGKEKIYVRYYPDGTMNDFSVYYESGNRHYSYDDSSNTLYTYADEENSWDPISTQAFTQQQAKEYIESLY